MTCITVIEKDEAFQVKVNYCMDYDYGVLVTVWTVDQQKRLWAQLFGFPLENIAVDFINEFTKRQAREIVKRYLRYEKSKQKTSEA